MNKVITIHLNGLAYQLEEAGYDALRAYLDHAASQLAGNPDQDEIIADIEQSISDKFRALIGPRRNVVLTADVQDVLTSMGPVDDGSPKPETGPSETKATPPRPENTGSANASTPDDDSADLPPPRPPKRLYRVREGAQLSGVCSGLGAYFNVDPVLFRIAFVGLAFVTFGATFVAYLIISLILPEAKTPEQKAAAHGMPSTAQEFINRARAGYYEASKKFRDPATRREWKRKFNAEMDEWRRNVHANFPSPYWRPSPMAGFTVALLGFLAVALTFVWLAALLSLLLEGSLFGFALPADLPLWAAILLLVVLFQLILVPIQVSRHALSGGCSSRPGSLAETLLGFVLLGLGLWFIDRYVPGAHEFFVQIPSHVDQFAAHLREWKARP